MSEQLTDWFPASVKPLRPGVYEVKNTYDTTRWFSFFDGYEFKWWDMTVGAAFSRRAAETNAEADFWRGLAADPHSRTDDSQTDDHTGICEVTE